MRTKVCDTNTRQGIGRRRFIRAAAGSTAGVALGGAPLFTACTTDSGVTVVTDQIGPTTVVDATGPTTTSLPATSAAPTTTEPALNLAATVWRLSTRAQRAPCAACKAHAAHRYFATPSAAEAGRAHAGCVCEIREQPTTAGQLQDWFTAGSEVHDDRWTT